MSLRSESEALVLGAGPVGLVAAAFLDASGLRVQVVDQALRTAARSYALALHPESLALLDDLGLTKGLLEHGHKVDRIAFYDEAERRAEVDLGRLDGAHPHLLILPQSELEGALARHLRGRNVPVEWNHRAQRLRLDEPGQVSIDVERMVEESAGYGLIRTHSSLREPMTLHASCLLGADGCHSAVRRALDLAYLAQGSSETFGVFEVEADWDVPEARVVLRGDGKDGDISVLWPLGDGGFRWSFQLPDALPTGPREKRRLMFRVDHEIFPHLEREELDRLLAERAPWLDPQAIRKVRWSVSLRFDRMLAQHFGRGGAWLLGDSAHLSGPVSMRSMNVGLREADVLRGWLHAILRGGAARQVLEGYNDDRIAEWTWLFDLPATATAREDAAPWVRANAGRLVDALPAAGQSLVALADQLDIDLPKPPWIE